MLTLAGVDEDFWNTQNKRLPAQPHCLMEGEVPRSLFIVEDSNYPLLLHGWERILQLIGTVIVSRSEWKSFRPEQLALRPESLLLANAAARDIEVLKLFRWLRLNPLPIATLAILPEGDDETLQVAASAVSDFLFHPVKMEELRHRLARLLISFPRSSAENTYRRSRAQRNGRERGDVYAPVGADTSICYQRSSCVSDWRNGDWKGTLCTRHSSAE
jgi:response regulator RpfG family c-di-GMP phosphodiesterase